MNCEEIRELLSLYIDNKLEEEQMIEIERHLLVCDACKKEFEEIVLVINAMKNLTEVEIPAQFDSGLREELKKAAESIRKSDKRNKRIRYSSIAAIFLIGIFSIACLLYTSDAADEEDSVDLGGRRIIKKKKKKNKK